MGFALLCLLPFTNTHTHTHPYPKSLSFFLSKIVCTCLNLEAVFNASGAYIIFLSHIKVDSTRNLLLNLPVICFLVSTSIIFFFNKTCVK